MLLGLTLATRDDSRSCSWTLCWDKTRTTLASRLWNETRGPLSLLDLTLLASPRYDCSPHTHHDHPCSWTLEQNKGPPLCAYRGALDPGLPSASPFTRRPPLLLDPNPNQVHSGSLPDPLLPASLPSTRQAGGRHLSPTPESNAGPPSPFGSRRRMALLDSVSRGGWALRAELSAPPRQALRPWEREGWGGARARAPATKAWLKG